MYKSIIKNNVNIISAFVYFFEGDRLVPYTIRDYKKITIDKISRNRYFLSIVLLRLFIRKERDVI